MMTLITGTPGAGKTLLAVQKISDFLDSGREVYTNIDGIKFPGIKPLPENNDWRKTPDGSVVVYDEAHQLFRTSGKSGLSDNPVINDMDQHRHTGHDIIFVTQYPTKLHFEVRSQCGEHIHVYRQMGAPSATLFKWPEAKSSPNDYHERQQADKEIWRYPKKLYAMYDSATIHTHKLKVPTKLKVFGMVILVLGSLVSYRVISHGGFASMSTDSPAPPAIAQREARARPAPARADHILSGCISSARACACYDSSGNHIPLDDAECRNIIANPLPISINKISQNSS